MIKKIDHSFIPYALPDISEDEIVEVTKCLKSGWITTGKLCKEFEEDFSNFLDIKSDSIAVNSATAGLHLALKAIGINPGDEVITTVHTFTATAEVIIYLGAIPIFVDIDESDLCINTNLIEKAITEKTKAIMPVHFAGHAANLDNIFDIADKYNLYVIEDAAHALPSTYKGKLIGSSKRTTTVFSFYANKTMTTGEGGMVTTFSEEIAKNIKIYRTHGISRDAFSRYISKKPSWYYEIIAPGYKYNLTDIAAAIGKVQLKKLLKMHEKRNLIAKKYDEELAGMPVILPPRMKNEIHSWHLYIIRLEPSLVKYRDQIIEKLFEEGIGCSVHYIPLHRHPYWRETFNLNPKDFPVSDKIFSASISLPIYSKMNEEDSTKVIEKLKFVLSLYS